MPIYEYRCDCGEVIEALVRGGREPQDAMDAGHYCDSPGKLVKLISAHNVGSGGGTAYRTDTGSAVSTPSESSCGHCGNTPGSCSYD